MIVVVLSAVGPERYKYNLTGFVFVLISFTRPYELEEAALIRAEISELSIDGSAASLTLSIILEADSLIFSMRLAILYKR